jgi:hypothetical protein
MKDRNTIHHCHIWGAELVDVVRMDFHLVDRTDSAAVVHMDCRLADCMDYRLVEHMDCQPAGRIDYPVHNQIGYIRRIAIIKISN